MARISTYQVDTNVTGADIWIGTDGNDNKKTKNFSPNILAKYLNENEVISTANSLRYRYDTIASGDSRKPGTISFQTEIGANVPFSSITTFILSNKTLGSNTVDAFLNILPNTRILIQNSSNINFFGIYFVNSITPHLTETGYYVVNLTYVSGNGNLSEDIDYLIHLVEYKTILPATPTLQSVTDEGDTTTTTVHLDGGALSDSINEQASFQPHLISTVNKNTGSGVELGSTGYVGISPDGVVGGYFAAEYVTEDVTLQFPNKPTGTYTIATTADIPSVTGYVPYTGATTNVNLGEYELKAGQVTLDTSPTGTAVVGTTRWNDTIGSSETTLKGGTVVLKNGVDLVARVVNKVTPNTTLLRSNYTAVRISGAQGQRLAIAYAQANNDANSADTIGLVFENIATNQEGFILTVGQFEEINTTGSLQGETWADGDVLYLSPTTAGRLTNIKPTGATGHIVVIGYVEYAHAVHGKIYVKIMNGWELDELHNVFITSPTNNQGLFYDSSDQLWKNETIASALGYTPVTNARTISTTSPLSGGGDLTADRTLSISQANTTTNGYLSSTDWNTFNGKQNALGYTPANKAGDTFTGNIDAPSMSLNGVNLESLMIAYAVALG